MMQCSLDTILSKSWIELFGYRPKEFTGRRSIACWPSAVCRIKRAIRGGAYPGWSGAPSPRKRLAPFHDGAASVPVAHTPLTPYRFGPDLVPTWQDRFAVLVLVLVLVLVFVF